LLRRRAKYRLQHVVRTNLAASDAAYQCVFETEDEAGIRGVKLSKELMSVAGKRTATQASFNNLFINICLTFVMNICLTSAICLE